ncbi:hypothetical protein OG285_32315 [Streptomyces sp. NBC_01471]|uniref:hypothetical protein n=1 Tax=Streptomyces sp. NBC_01471 TaxID=2903879 RepID=UPI0032491A90
MSHQMCVPGGWQDIATLQYRARETLAGIYAPDGADIKDIALRASAEMLFSHASTVIVTHPYVRLDRLVTTVDPEQGTEGEPGVAMEICQLLRGSKIL